MNNYEVTFQHKDRASAGESFVSYPFEPCSRCPCHDIGTNIINDLGCDILAYGVVSLQYADYTILLLDKNLEKVKKLKKFYLVLC